MQFAGPQERGGVSEVSPDAGADRPPAGAHVPRAARHRAAAALVALFLPLLAACHDARGNDADGALPPATAALPGPWVFVDDFGATPDDGFDDRIAIHAAVAAVPAGGRVMFGPGRYVLLGPLNVDKDGVLLQGAGASTRLVAAADMPALVHFGADGKKLQGCGATALALDGAGRVQEALLLVQNTRDSTFSGLRLSGSRGWGLVETTDTNSGSTHSPRNLYQDLDISGNDAGGALWEGSKNTIVGHVNAHGNGGDGLVFRALLFGNGTGALESTQCVIGDSKSSDNAGYGFVFDGTAKLTAGNLNSNHNALGGYLLADSQWEPGLAPSAGVVSGTLTGLCSRNDGLGRPPDEARVLETAPRTWVSDLTVTGLLGIQPEAENDGLGVRVGGWRNAILSNVVLRNTRLAVEAGSRPDGVPTPSRHVVTHGVVVTGVPGPAVSIADCELCLLDDFVAVADVRPALDVRGDVKIGLGHP